MSDDNKMGKGNKIDTSELTGEKKRTPGVLSSNLNSINLGRWKKMASKRSKVD